VVHVDVGGFGHRKGLAFSALATALLVLTACSQAGATGMTVPGSRAANGGGNSGAGSRNSTASACTPVSDAVARVESSVVRIETPPDAKGEVSAGTGFVIDNDIVLTNDHVVSGVTRVRASFMNGGVAVGQVLATNEAQDLALIQVDTGDIPPVVWGDDRTLSKGTPLSAIGYAGDRRGPPSITRGTYLQTYVDPPTGQAYLLSNVGLEHGDSGGPLLNQCGQVVGVNTARIRSEDRAGLSIPEFLAQRWANEQLQQQH
jgi:S1-C subfamily serine protease